METIRQSGNDLEQCRKSVFAYQCVCMCVCVYVGVVLVKDTTVVLSISAASTQQELGNAGLE